MLIVRKLSVVAAIVTAMPAAAQSSFEGVIVFTATSAGRPATDTMIQTTKGSMLRFETVLKPGQKEQGAMIYDFKAHTMTVLMMHEKKYMIMPIKQTETMTKAIGDVKLTKTGRTATVAGVSCQIYHASRTNERGTKEGEACFAKGVGLAMMDIFAGMGGRGGGNSAVEAFHDLAKEDLHMLKAWELKDGSEQGTLEAVKIDRKSVDASLFAIPAGFTKVEMPSMPHPPQP